MFLQGRIQTTKSSEGKYFTDIVIDRMQMLGSKPESSEDVAGTVSSEKAPF